MNDTIELWEAEITKSYNSNTFESLSEQMFLLNESIKIDVQLLDEEVITEGVKEFFVNIGSRIDDLITRFKTFLRKIIRILKEKFSKKTTDVSTKARTEFAKEHTISDENFEKADKEAKEYISKSFMGSLVGINVTNLSKSFNESKKHYGDLDKFVKSIKNLSIDELQKKQDEIENYIKDQKATDVNSQNKEYFDKLVDKYVLKIDPDLGSDFEHVTNSLNKLEDNSQKAIQIFTEYIDHLFSVSEGMKTRSVIETFKSKLNDKNPDEDNDSKKYQKLLSSYCISLSAFFYNEKEILSALMKIIANQKKDINHIFNIYKQASEKA